MAGLDYERTRIQLCGRLSVEIEGVQRASMLRGKQVPLLLAYLLLNRDRYVGREELIGALWPERAPVSQDAALRTLLSRLRSALGSSTLVGRDELILELPSPVWVDLEAAVSEIERAEQGLRQGDARRAWALAQVPLNIASRGLLPGSQASWLEPRRRELADIRLKALEVIGRAGLSLGGAQLSSVERAARGMIETDPYRESGYLLLMEALGAQGNLAEGLRVFERLRVLLRDELGTAPSPETIAAHQRLLLAGSHQPPEAAEPEDETAAVALPAELLARSTAPLVGRTQELAELTALWTLARERPLAGLGHSEPHDASRVVLLTGDPGVGKTRLVAELARKAHDAGAFVLAGRSPHEPLIPYQPFVEALRHYVLSVPIGQLRAASNEYGSELARLVPELRRRAPELPPPLEGGPETERYRLFEAVVGLFTQISVTAPVLLVLDDLHWADRPTLMLLRHLARTPESRRLLILGAYRATEAHSDGFLEALSELRREHLVTQIEVAGLSEHETSDLIALLAQTTPSASFSRALHAKTEGNPFFVQEIVRHLGEAGVDTSHAGGRELERFGLPEGVKEVLARRLARLDAQAIEWLRVAAVIGRDVDLSLLEQVASLDEDQFLNALDEALAAGLVAESPDRPGRYSFSHALIRETLYEGMSAPRRARTHRRVGEALEATYGERFLTALALHFTRAAGPQDADKAIRYASRAGAQATAMLAHEEAAEHYARALEVLDRFEPEDDQRRCELLLALGEARVRAAERPQARLALREAAAVARRLGDAQRLARAAIWNSRRYIQSPGVVDEESIAMLEEALELTAGEQTVTRVRLLERLCGELSYAPDRARMKPLSAEADAAAAKLGDPEARAYACAARRRAYWEPHHLEERLSAATELLTLARELEDLELTLQGHAWLAVDLLEQGDRDASEAQMEAFTELAERLRQPFYIWNASYWRAMRALLDGRLADADRLAAAALEPAAPAQSVSATQYYATQLLVIRHEQGRLAEVEEAARRFVAGYPTIAAWRAALGRLLWEVGKYEEARQELELLAAKDFEDIPRDGNWLIAITLLGELCAELGDEHKAARLHELLLPFSELNVVAGVATVCLGSAARYLGLLAATARQDQAAESHFERALIGNAALRAPVCLAHTQLDYARWLIGRDGEAPHTRAAELIGKAAQTAAQLDLPAVALRASIMMQS